MKKFIVILISILVLFSNLEAQNISSRNGGCFTPKDSIKVLMVFVSARSTSSGNINHPVINGVWGTTQQYPEVVRNKQLFYSDYSEFNNPIDPVKENWIYRWYVCKTQNCDNIDNSFYSIKNTIC